jgi:hypothetical protein
MGAPHSSLFPGRSRGLVVVDVLLAVVAVLVLVGLVLFEIFHVRTVERIEHEEDGCVRKNLTALNQALDFARLNQSDADNTSITLLDLQTNVIHFAGCVVEVEGRGRGEVTYPTRNDEGKVESDGTLKVRFFQGGGEAEFKVDDFTGRLVCPAGGTYSVGRLGGSPRCNVPGHALGN